MNKSASTRIEKEVESKFKSYFQNKPHFIIGVSGGADSMALLYVLKKLQISGIVIHVNYHQRAEESDKDQELVESIAFEWGFECCSISLDDYEESKGNFQQWARDQRYQMFSDLMKEFSADGIVVAHHKDDQIETILHKLLRGNSPETWKGMQIFENDIFRPMLSISKSEILQYCMNNVIPYREDVSNSDSKYTRNLIRNELSQSLNELIPGWQQNVLNLQEFGTLNELAVEEITCQITQGNSINIERLLHMPSLLKQALLRKFLEFKGYFLSSGQLQEADNLLSSQTGAKLELLKHVYLIKDRDSLVIKDNSQDAVYREITKKELQTGVTFLNIDIGISKHNFTGLYLDADALSYPLVLRNWRNGDKIQPFGMQGSQKISDHLTNKKISTINREKTLVLTGTDGTIYAIIFEANHSSEGTISELCKVTDSTINYLSVTKK